MTRKKSFTISIFIAYAREDESLRERLDKHLSTLKRTGKAITWHDGKIEAGKEWEKSIFNALSKANIILLLISVHFIDSDYCYDVEMKHAIERHENGTAIIIPIVLSHCDWKDTPFSKLQMLPKDARPVMDRTWSNEDEALENVAIGIKTVVQQEISKRENTLKNYYEELTSLKEEITNQKMELESVKKIKEKIVKKNESSTKLQKSIKEKDTLIQQQEITILELKKELNKFTKTNIDSTIFSRRPKIEIINSNEIYSTLNQRNGELWINEEVKAKAGIVEWKKEGFYPKNGMVGEIIDCFEHLNNFALIYIILVNEKYYVPIAANGIKVLNKDD